LSRTVPKPSRASRRAEAHEREREEMLDAALASFADRGFEATSVHDVAAAARVSVGHIYNLIGNKRTLYEAVIDREGKEMMRAVDATLDGLSSRPAVERLDALIDTALAFVDEHRGFFRLYLNETGGAHVRIEARFPKKSLRYKRSLDRKTRDLFAEGIRQGDLARLDPEDLMIAFQDLVNGFIARWVASGFRGDVRKRAPVIRRILWHGIAADTATRRSKS
jgi:AcrR family transcriptional regulator